jgi:hypothetical protein
MTFIVLCIPIVFHSTLKNFIISRSTKNVFFFFQLAMNQMITFNASLDSEKKTLPDQACLKNYVHVSIKKKKVDYR